MKHDDAYTNTTNHSLLLPVSERAFQNQAKSAWTIPLLNTLHEIFRTFSTQDPFSQLDHPERLFMMQLWIHSHCLKQH
jgi:hypothetical protein